MLEAINELAAIEAIQFQYDKKFPERLTYLFQTMIDWSKEYNDKFGRPTSTKEHKAKMSKLVGYTETTIVPEFIKTVSKYTGLTNLTINVMQPENISATYFFAMQCTDMSLFSATNETSNVFSRASVKRGSKLEKLIAIAESIDSKGRVRELGDSIPFTIYLPLGAIVAYELYPIDTVLSAKEIASIMLHEIGHAMTFLEYAANMQFTGYFGNSILENISTDIKEYPEETYSAIKKSIKKLKTSDLYKKSKAVAKNIDTSEKVIDKYFDKENEEVKYNAFMALIVNVIAIVIVMLNYIVIDKLYVILIATGTNDTLNIGSSIVDNKSRSASNVERRMSTFERLADEYVARFGMSKYLNTGLLKVTDVMTKTAGRGVMLPIFNETLRSSKVMRATIATLTFPNALGMSIVTAGMPGGTYETFLKRLERNIQNMKVALKDKNIPKDFRNTLLDDIAVMEKDLKAYRRKIGPMVGIIVKGLGQFLAKTKSLPLTMFTGNVASNYGKLFETLDSLFTNDFYRKAAEIERALDE